MKLLQYDITHYIIFIDFAFQKIVIENLISLKHK